jgi:glycolate oxidase
MGMAFTPEEMGLFQSIKRAFDPNNILNPSKMGLE